MKPYSSYKDSGVEWIGALPSHWTLKKTKYISTNTDGKRIPLSSEIRGDLEKIYPYYGSNGIIDYVDKFIFDGEYILVGEDGSPFFDRLKDVSFFVDGQFWVNNHCHILKSNSGIESKYFVHSFNCVDYHEYITGSTRDKLTQQQLDRITHPYPSLKEQKQIVSFLDHKTKKIDELIEKTEKKIELLKEKRTSLINHCVTKGLNPNAEMKNSGVEWIGEIPSHWSVKLLKFVFNPIREISKTGEEELLSVLIQKGVVRRKDYLGEDFDHLTRSESLIGYIKCSKGNLVNNIMKMGFYCLGITHYDGIVSPGYSVFEIRDNNDYPKYWDYLLKTEIYVNEFRKRSKGIQESRMRLYDDYFLSIHSLYPSKDEQRQIVEYLDEHTKQIDSTVDKETQRIELLKEYRQSLISEVVTGKIDVRDWNNDTQKLS